MSVQYRFPRTRLVKPFVTPEILIRAQFARPAAGDSGRLQSTLYPMQSSALQTFFRSRWRYVIALTVAMLCLWSLWGMSKLRIVSDPSEMLQTPDPALDELARDFHIESSDLLVMIEADTSVLAPDTLKALHQIHLQVQECDGVKEAWSLWSLRSSRRVGRYVLPLLTPRSLEEGQFDVTKAQLESHPLARGHLLSIDQSATLLLVRTTEQIGEVDSVEKLTQQIEAIVDRELTATPLPGSPHGQVTGFPVVHAEIHHLMQRDQYLFNLVGFAAGAAIGWLLLRRMAAVVCVAVGPLTGVCLTMGLAGYWDVPITIINSTMPLIILIVGYADAIHLILSVRDHLANGFTKDQAVALAVRQLWAPCFFTSLTTAVGFASLMISHVGTIRDFGALTALGCVINFFAVLLVVPIAASFFGDQLSRPRRSGDANSHRSEPFAATSHWLGKFVARFAKPITVAGLCSIAFSLWCTTQLHTSNRLADSIPHDGPTYQTYRMCEEKFGGAAEIYVRVAWSDDQSLQSPQVIKTLLAVEDAVRRQKNLGPPLSVLDVMRSLPDPFEGESLSGKQILALHQLGESARERMLNEQRHRAIVTARVPDMGVDELRAVMNQLESELKTQTVNYANIDVAVVGEIATTVRIFQQLVTDLLWSVLLASVVIFSLMTLQFRSWRVGLLSVVPSAFSLLGAAAILYLSGTPLQLASLVCFTICLGISVDDTIHFLARYRVLRPRLDRETASVETLVHIGPALFITSVVFVIGFGTVLLSRVPVLQTFSWLACVSLILALAGDTLLLPALLVTLARLSPKKSQARAASQAAVAMIPPPAHLHANKGASTETVSPSDGRLRPGNSSENRNAI